MFSSWRMRLSSLILVFTAPSIALSQSPRVEDAKAEAQEILSQPLFYDGGPKEAQNWLGKVAEFLAKTILDWIEKLLSNQQANFNPSWIPPNVGSAVIWVVIGILLALLIAATERNIPLKCHPQDEKP